jgi:hypothetical protein
VKQGEAKLTYVKPSLADPYLKAGRAKVHLDSLRAEIDAFCQTKPYSIAVEDDLEKGLCRISAGVRDPPETLHLIFGDLLYCLRSSLDQLVFALAHLTIPYPDHTQFPILDVDIALDKEVRKRFAKQTRGVPSGAIHVIESLQPYHGGNAAGIEAHLLWRLNLLCNIDKHRRVPVHGTVTDFVHILPTEAGPYIGFDDDHSVVTVPMRFKDNVNLKPKTTVNILFGDLSAGIQCDAGGIERIYNFVASDVIPRFTRFF